MLNCIAHTEKQEDREVNKTGRAFFVAFPRIMEDLKVLHDIKKEQEYEIMATVKLGATDYENFITDMGADRQFIEDHCDVCSVGRIWKCLLVQQKGKKDGVLVIPIDQCFVKYAAYYAGN